MEARAQCMCSTDAERREGRKGRVARLATSEYVYEAELAKGGEIEVAADGKIIKGPKSMEKGSTAEK